MDYFSFMIFLGSIPYRVDSVFEIGFFKWVFTSVFTVFSSCKNHGFYDFYGFYGF